MKNILLLINPTNRKQKIFQNTSLYNFKYLSCFSYERLPVNIQIFKNVNNGNCDWLLFTSFKAWKFFTQNLNKFKFKLHPKIKIAVFGEITASRILQSGQRIDFSTNDKKSISFIHNFVKYNTEIKLIYFTSTSSKDHIENVLHNNAIKTERHNLYSPTTIINSKVIKTIFDETHFNSLVFFSSDSVNVFFNKCPNKIINKVKDMSHYAIGKKTVNTLKYHSIIAKCPTSPSFVKLSKLINKDITK
jgi:uroporphyrinogen-III synthase